MSPEYRVVWTSTWDTIPREVSSCEIPTLEEAKEHRDFVDLSPYVMDMRIQVREWADLETPIE